MKKSENLIEYLRTKVRRYEGTKVPSYEGTKVPSTCTVTCTAVLVLYSQMYVVLPEVRKYYFRTKVRVQIDTCSCTSGSINSISVL
jgi:hypothetical protein